ncbi:MAG: molybdopterin-dependent oxidoreductase, partial [Rhodobacteraceae bacterium]|nr:molybdopterin-dependent oxidoreductase [Paracoccaceae bacterium]
CRVRNEHLPAIGRAAYAGTARIADIDTARHIVLVGTSPDEEIPVLNARIRMAWLAGCPISSIGAPFEATYAHERLGEDLATLQAFASGLEDADCDGLLILLGMDALAESSAPLATAMQMVERGAGLLVVHRAAARVGALDVGFIADGGLEAALDGAGCVFNLGMDEVDIAPGPFVIYQGSHGDRGAQRADVILPAAAYTEEGGIFVNTEGRPQLAMRCVFPPGDAREGWSIVRALSDRTGSPLPYDTLDALRDQLFAERPHLAMLDRVPENPPLTIPATNGSNVRFRKTAGNYHLTNPIARASRTMAEVVREADQLAWLDSAA